MKIDYIKVGKIANTHGIRGELKVLPLTDFEDRFSADHHFYLGEEKKTVRIDKVRFHKGAMIMSFDEFDNINEVEKYKGDFLYINKEDRVILPEDTFYVDDLIGFSVYEEEQLIGTLKEIQTSYVNDIYLVDTGEGELMIPCVKEFILGVDLEAKKINVRLIEGM